jgi:hypothetical protein
MFYPQPFSVFPQGMFMPPPQTCNTLPGNLPPIPQNMQRNLQQVNSQQLSYMISTFPQAFPVVQPMDHTMPPSQDIRHTGTNQTEQTSEQDKDLTQQPQQPPGNDFDEMFSNKNGIPVHDDENDMNDVTEGDHDE